MRRTIKYCLLVLLILGAVGLLHARGEIGLTEQAMCQENGDTMEPGDSFTAQIGQSMAAFLHYNVEEDKYDLDIYVRRRNRFGWFFRLGSASSALDYLMQLNCEGNEAYVLTWLSPVPSECRIEVDKGSEGIETIVLKSGVPFVYVMDHRWNVTVYGADGSVMEPVKRNM